MQGLLRSTPPGLLTQFKFGANTDILIRGDGVGYGALEVTYPIRFLSHPHQIPIRFLSYPFQNPIRSLSDSHQLTISVLTYSYQIPIRSLSYSYQIPIRLLADS